MKRDDADFRRDGWEAKLMHYLFADEPDTNYQDVQTWAILGRRRN